MWTKNKHNFWITAAVIGVVLESWALYVVGASPEHWRPAMIVKNEPAAHALYCEMIDTLRRAESLSYNSVCSGPDYRASNYSVSLRKPGYFHVGAANGLSKKCNVLLGDGESMWMYWLGDRPFLSFDTYETHKATRAKVYITKAAPPGRYSVGRDISLLGLTWFATILDPSIFHGYADPLEPYIDGARSRGPDDAGGENCDVIEVSYMDAQLTRYFWISRRDQLPRQVKQIDRRAENIVRVEEWSQVKLNSAIPQQKFVWSPPDGWRQWNAPGPDDCLLKSGREAPDFDLLSADGGRIKLSDYRGKIVWLFVWRAGSPACREAMPYLQKLQEQYEGAGVIILGFNCIDNKRIARSFLRDKSVTFANVLDCSDAAGKVMLREYANKMQVAPVNYIIDAQGKIVDAWWGNEEGYKRAIAVLAKAGLVLAEE